MKDLTIGKNQVDIWRIDLTGQVRGNYRSLLSEDEVQRADRFCFETHRQRFVAARAALRCILGCYANAAPQKVVFSYTSEGKPEFSGSLKECGIMFNSSRSESVALLAVARTLSVGIDIEFVNPGLATEGIAEHFFSENEVKTLQALPFAQRAEAFFSCWTRKEAYIKALGGGLLIPLNSFDVAFGPGVTAKLLGVRGDPVEVTRWCMYDIEAAPGYKAALVAEGKEHRLRHLQWESKTLH